ncbi:hypothetical protein BCT06_12725 [Vibrio breoganii]|uniref:helicase RepA family protein n=1 Tax=Vibrio breoganii TaxID=553239 RepID=UPI000C843CB4|nr:helicase RepA family protein [Vibrio breoganii]PMO60354.1 hypothetical protein BCT06_12725 [Vibrio breoganii]
MLTKSRNTDLLKQEKILADAICHEVSISFTDADNIDTSLVSDQRNKRIINAFKTLYQDPRKQPNNKQIADEVHQAMLEAAYSDGDTNAEADAIEELKGRRIEPDSRAVVTALESLSLPAADKPKSLFKFQTGFDGYDREFSYLIKGYLPMNSFGMVYGASGSFKSFHALSWATHIALGKEWNGHKVNQSPVLYVAGEGGIGVPRRIKALADTYNNGNPIKDLYRLDHPVAMGDIAEVNQLADTIEHYSETVGKKFGLVIVDTLARCFGTGDENKTEDMSRFVSACDRLKAQVGVTVLIVHHSGVADKERARGSSALRAACDFEFRVERAKQESPALILASTKAKDDKENPKQMFQLVNVPLFVDSDGDEVKSLVASNVGEEPPVEEEKEDNKLSSNEQLVYQVVRARQQAGDPTTREIIRDDLKAQGTDIKNFGRWLKGCLDKGVLACNDDAYSTVVSA